MKKLVYSLMVGLAFTAYQVAMVEGLSTDVVAASPQVADSTAAPKVGPRGDVNTGPTDRRGNGAGVISPRDALQPGPTIGDPTNGRTFDTNVKGGEENGFTRTKPGSQVFKRSGDTGTTCHSPELGEHDWGRDPPTVSAPE